MRRCCICKKNDNDSGPFFTIPKDERRLLKWIEACRKEFPPNSFICSDHFLPSDIIRGAKRVLLMPNAVPYLPISWNICRVCLQEENPRNKDTVVACGQMRLLSSYADNKLFKHIFDCSGVVVKPNDGLPEKICQKCLKFLNYAIHFRKTCIKSDTKLKLMIQRTKSAATIFKDERSKDILEDANVDDPLYCADERLMSNNSLRVSKVDVLPGDPLHYKEDNVEECLPTNNIFQNIKEESQPVDIDINHERKPIQKELKRLKKSKTLDIEKRPQSLHYIGEDIEEYPTKNNSFQNIKVEPQKLTQHFKINNGKERHREIKIQEIKFFHVGKKSQLDSERLALKYENVEQHIKEESQKSPENFNINHNSKRRHQQIEMQKNAKSLEVENMPPLDEQNAECKDGVEISVALEDMEVVLNQTNVVADGENSNTTKIVDEETEHAAEEDYTILDCVDFVQLEGDMGTQQIGDDDGVDNNINHVISMVVNDRLEIELDYTNLKQSDNARNVDAECNIDKQVMDCDTPAISRTQKNCVCDVCGNYFSSQQLLNTHMHIHRQEKPIAKVKNTNKNTKIHPFTCEYCGNVYALAANLKAHQRIHVGVKLCGCELCVKSFKLEHQLKVDFKSSLHQSLLIGSLMDQ